MKKLITAVLLLISAAAANAQMDRPKLVVGIVVDQMRWDYLYYYGDDYGSGGVNRLLREGYSFENTEISHAPATTAAGHAGIYTGSVPSLHGIAGNNFRQNGRRVYCCEDSSVQSVGSTTSEGQRSPRRMLATTIGDELRLATDFRSRVFSVALKDRAAILPAGHSANAAYWWDTNAGHFVTSTYYMDELPAYVVTFNEKYRREPGFDIKESTVGVTTTFRLAEAVLANERLGQGDATDMLCISISSTDAIGHTFATHSKETRDVYVQLDRDIADFLDTLDRVVGTGNYLLFLCADHGASHNYNYLREHNIPSGAWNAGAAARELDAYLRSTFNAAETLVTGAENYQFFLDDAAVARAGADKQAVIDAAVAHLKADSAYLYVSDSERLAEAPIPAKVRERLVNGYFRGRSGEITVVTRPQVFDGTESPDYRGTTHGQPLPYDVHIPFVLMGRGVSHGASTEPTSMADIAPTICSLLHIQAPDASIGQVRTMTR